MPRPLRIEYEGAWYHVMNRGLNHQVIFQTNQHRRIFLGLLERISDEFCIEIHSFCLMDNHYHLLVRTPLANLSKAMRYLNGVFTQKYNISINRDGPLFRGRYKAILVEEDNHLLQVSKYIHLNPVEAKICKTPGGFKWSSYNAFVKLSAIHPWLHKDFILSLLAKNKSPLCYESFVNEILDEYTSDFYKKKESPSIFGSKNFTIQNLRRLDPAYKIAVQSDYNRSLRLPKIEHIARMVAKYFDVEISTLYSSRRRCLNLPRLAGIYLTRLLGHYKHKHIADHYTNINCRSISLLLKRCNELAESDAEFRQHVVCLRTIIMKEDS